MVKHVLFVTSTSNEVNYDKRLNEDGSNEPRLVELSWILTDSKLRVISVEKGHYMVPDTVKRISKNAKDKNGLTMEFLRENAEPVSEVILKFTKDLMKTDRIVGIDLWMTKKLLNREVSSISPETSFGSVIASKDGIDILDCSRKLVGLKYANLKSGVRRPLFFEVVKKLTGEDIPDKYDQDTINYLVRCYAILEKLGIISWKIV